jgi:hypothetical protein
VAFRMSVWTRYFAAFLREAQYAFIRWLTAFF